MVVTSGVFFKPEKKNPNKTLNKDLNKKKDLNKTLNKDNLESTEL